MTLSPYEPESGAVVPYTAMGQSVIALRDWAEAARAAHIVATSLCKTSFVPKEYRGKPDETTAAILAGMEVGLSPIAAINASSPIMGQAAPKAITLRAIVQSRGHEIELVESTASRCIMRGRRAGHDEWQTVTWGIDRAKQLGLLAKKESQWPKQPTAMLVARATSEISRLIAADAILGIPYSAEELRDQSGEVDPEQAAPAAPRNRRRTPVAPIAPAQALKPATDAPAQAGPPPLPGEPGYTAEAETAPADAEAVEDDTKTFTTDDASTEADVAGAALAEHFGEVFDADAE